MGYAPAIREGADVDEVAGRCVTRVCLLTREHGDRRDHIGLVINERYQATLQDPVERYFYSALDDPAVAGLTAFSRSHPMAIGTKVGDLLYGAGRLNAVSGTAVTEASAAVQEPGTAPATSFAGVDIRESFQIDGAISSPATVRFHVGFLEHGDIVQVASQETSAFVRLYVRSADQSVLIAHQLAGGKLCTGLSYYGTHCNTTYFEGDARNGEVWLIDPGNFDSATFHGSDSFILEAIVPTGIPLTLNFNVSTFANCTPDWNPACATSSAIDANVDLLFVSDGTLVTQHGWLVPEPATELEAAAALGALTLCARRRT